MYPVAENLEKLQEVVCLCDVFRKGSNFEELKDSRSRTQPEQAEKLKVINNYMPVLMISDRYSCK